MSRRFLLDAFARSMRSPVRITNVNQREFAPGFHMRCTVVTTVRLILIVQGKMSYLVDGEEYDVGAGEQFLVPSWSRREWSTQAHDPCELIWCEFDDDPCEIGRHPFFYRRLSTFERTQEWRAYRLLRRLWEEARAAEVDTLEGEMLALKLEGSLKSMLSRFWSQACAAKFPRGHDEKKQLHPKVKWASQWIEKNYTDANALTRLYREHKVSPGYLRQLFRATMHCTPGDYLKQVRMRQARYLLESTDWLQKRIAYEVGYADALYFSKQYRKFWGHSPAVDRRKYKGFH